MDQFWGQNLTAPYTLMETRLYALKTIEYAQRCAAFSGSLLEHISTADTVRDLDYFRQLVELAKPADRLRRTGEARSRLADCDGEQNWFLIANNRTEKARSGIHLPSGWRDYHLNLAPGLRGVESFHFQDQARVTAGGALYPELAQSITRTQQEFTSMIGWKEREVADQILLRVTVVPPGEIDEKAERRACGVDHSGQLHHKESGRVSDG